MPKPKEQAASVNDISRIASCAVINGDVSSDTDLRIDGHVVGTVYSAGRIVVGENAVLNGTILCENLDFWGKVDGDIYVRDTLSLKSSSVVNGNVKVRHLSIELGAQLNGSCSMNGGNGEFDNYVKSIVKNTL